MPCHLADAINCIKKKKKILLHIELIASYFLGQFVVFLKITLSFSGLSRNPQMSQFCFVCMFAVAQVHDDFLGLQPCHSNTEMVQHAYEQSPY